MIILPSQAFLPYRPVKTLDVRLFVLPIRASNAVTITEQRYLALELCLELRPSISLQQIHMAIKPPLHAPEEKLTAVFCRQRWCQ